MKTSRTTLPLSEEEREAIKTIREHYGVKSDADAIRIALRELERVIKGGTQPGAYRPPDGAVTPQAERRSHPPQE